MKKNVKNQNIQDKEKNRKLKLSLFGIARTAILMASLLLFVKSFYVYGTIGIILYGIVLFFEKRFKSEN